MVPAAGEGRGPADLGEQRVARVLDNGALGRRVDEDLRVGDREVAVARLEFLPGAVVLRQHDGLHAQPVQLGQHRGVEMHAVVLVAREHGIVEDDEARALVLGPRQEQGEAEAVELRLAEDGDDVADLGGGAVGIRRQAGLEVDGAHGAGALAEGGEEARLVGTEHVPPS